MYHLRNILIDKIEPWPNFHVNTKARKMSSNTEDLLSHNIWKPSYLSKVILYATKLGEN